jgi:Domain of unknown function (DUF4160)
LSPTVLRKDGYRFFFFSREEPRMHVHVSASDGEAKWWLEPTIELAYNHRMSPKQLRETEAIIHEHLGDIVDAWKRHFGN